MNVRDLNVWIIGAARSGIAAARILHQQGAKLFVSDQNKIEDEHKKVLEELKIPFEEQGHSVDKLLREAQLVVISPSVPLDKPVPLAARQVGIPVVSEIEVAGWFLPRSAFVVGITGTNGKSTTTHYASQLLALGQLNSVACGNYGRPLADAVLDPARYNAFVAELSSYQLETTYSLRPNVTIFLNLQVDHQARYQSMEEYLKAKWRLTLLTRDDGLAIIDGSVLRRALRAGLPMPTCRVAIICEKSPFSEKTSVRNEPERRTVPLPAEVEFLTKMPTQTYGELGTLPFERLLANHELTYLWVEKKSESGTGLRMHVQSQPQHKMDTAIDVSIPCLPGPHNQINIAAGSLTALFTGMHPNIIRAQWNSASTVYNHLAHRLEAVAKGELFQSTKHETKSVQMINDSKATNVESTLVAVKSFPNSVRLLLGGEPKGDSYAELLPFIGKNVCRVYPFGKAAPLICEQLAEMKSYLAPASKRMAEAAQLALDEANDGDIILLSPACASFDEFRNFEHRGDAFRHWALSRVQTKST